MPYDQGWRASPVGKTIARNWHIKEKFVTMSDAKLNTIIHSARAIDLGDFSTIALIKEIMKRNPLLLADLAGLMSAIK
jgi:digeranylgeranylglycerophospholipid reductase